MPSTTIYVTASEDDAEEYNDGAVNSAWPDLGESQFMVGFIFRAVPIPPGATVSTALFMPVALGTCSPNLVIKGEIAPADFAASLGNLSDRSKTSAGVIWDEEYTYLTPTTITSPNIAPVIQEIIDYGDWAENEDLALFAIDRGLGGTFLMIYAYDFGPNTYPPALFLEWTVPVITGELDYGWPGDYWPDEYFAEYWPDYGTATPPGNMGPVAFMHLQRMHRRSSL